MSCGWLGVEVGVGVHIGGALGVHIAEVGRIGVWMWAFNGVHEWG
jgi:hypothetical protein